MKDGIGGTDVSRETDKFPAPFAIEYPKKSTPSMEMPSIGSLTVPQVQHTMAQNRKFLVAAEKIISIVGNNHPIAEILREVMR